RSLYLRNNRNIKKEFRDNKKQSETTESLNDQKISVHNQGIKNLILVVAYYLVPYFTYSHVIVCAIIVKMS
ncbi:MAG: hypothetical protein COB99_04125, partial [Sulfurimonas sp.]